MSRNDIKEPSSLAKVILAFIEDPIKFFQLALNVEPDEQQKELILEAVKPNSRVMVKSARGTGKALVNGEPVYTPTGTIAVEDLKEDDLICNSYGSSSKVKGVYPQGKKDCYKVYFNDGTFSNCSIDHLWNVRYKNDKRKSWKTISLEQILEDGIRILRKPTDRCKKGFEYRYAIPKTAPVEFNEIPIVTDPYLLGLWLGDGCRGTGIITNIDEEVWNYIKSKGYELGKKQYQSRRILGFSKELRKLGIIDKYSFEKRIPKIYLNNSIKVRIKMLQALMDTDGTIDKKGLTTYYTTSLGLAKDFLFLVRSLGCFTKGIKIKKTTHRDCYVIHFRAEHIDRLFRIERKEQRRKKDRKGGVRYITGVEYLGKQECTCISVDSKDKLFLTRNFIPTHNTFVISGLALYFMLCFKDVNIRVLSPSEQQLKNVFQREIQKHLSNMRPELADLFEVRSMSLHNKQVPLNKCACVTASVERTENVSGVHSGKQIYLLDEASAIPNNIYSTVIGSLGTAEGGGHIIGCSNPNRGGSTFYVDLFAKNLKGWKLLTFTAMKCAHIPKSFIDEMKETYGEDGDEYRVSVLGEFPRADSSTFIPEAIVEEATKRYLERGHYLSYPLVMGVDIARSLSGDATVFVIRQGPKIHEVISFKTDDTMVAVSRVLDTLDRYNLQRIYIDATGVGGGPSDRLKEIFKQRNIFIPVVDVIVAQKSRDPLQYHNLRAELWGEMREWLVTADIPEHYELRKELIEMTWGYSGKMAIQLTNKKQLKNEGISSPDHADALSMTFYDSNLTVRPSIRYIKPKKIKRANILWA